MDVSILHVIYGLSCWNQSLTKVFGVGARETGVLRYSDVFNEVNSEVSSELSDARYDLFSKYSDNRHEEEIG